MWISSVAGLAVYDSKLKDVTWYKFNNVTENEFYAVDFVDEDNRIWHVNINGLQYFDPAMQQFTIIPLNSLVVAIGVLLFIFYPTNQVII
jgi:streptogramin lyase